MLKIHTGSCRGRRWHTSAKDERQTLHRGDPLVKLLDVADPSHLLVLAASHIDVTPQRFAERSPRLWRGQKVPRTGTFENPVQPENVAQMTLPLRTFVRCGDVAEEIAT